MGQIDRKAGLILQGLFFCCVIGFLTVVGAVSYGVLKLFGLL